MSSEISVTLFRASIPVEDNSADQSMYFERVTTGYALNKRCRTQDNTFVCHTHSFTAEMLSRYYYQTKHRHLCITLRVHMPRRVGGGLALQQISIKLVPKN